MRPDSYAGGSPRPPAAPVLAVLALGTAVLGTSELGVSGLIPAISADLNVSAGAAGALVAVYAVAVALAGPVLTAVLGCLPRRRVLIAALGTLAAGNGATAAAPGFPALLAARALTGAAAAVYVAIALTVATGLAGSARRGRAIAVVFGGVTVSTVLGVPAATALGSVVGWRAVYGVLTIASAGALVAAVRVVPEPAAGSSPPLPAPVRTLTRPRLLATFTVNAVITAGYYTASTYLVVLLTRQTGLSTAAASAVLLTNGIAATAGNLAGGVAADRHPQHTMIVAAALVAASLGVVPLVMTDSILTWLVTLVLATAFPAFSTAAQLAVSQQAGSAADVAAAVNISVFNTGIAGGSAVGGLILHRAGFTGVNLLGAALVLAGLAGALLAVRWSRDPVSVEPVSVEPVLEPAPVAVRVAYGDDRPAALDVWREANSARGRPPDAQRIARVRAKLAAPDALLLIACAGTKVLGILLAEPGRGQDGQGPRLDGLCHISMVFVHPDHWGRRVGELLIGYLADQAGSHGYLRLQLWTGADNDRALRLYRRVGFVPSGRISQTDSGAAIVQFVRSAAS
ncbi:MFS transporter [Frankia sp. QA3]|uniref:MFS transporter n=1 Tax=Frankia sp. QA3 TaxID=710111 RepID=UPI000269C170|nr:MFS transporter [Frankia sp. QA3]EIV92076.1 arabinose efflux permease family protein [Frankia sp. QA3]